MREKAPVTRSGMQSKGLLEPSLDLKQSRPALICSRSLVPLRWSWPELLKIQGKSLTQTLQKRMPSGRRILAAPSTGQNQKWRASWYRTRPCTARWESPERRPQSCPRRQHHWHMILAMLSQWTIQRHWGESRIISAATARPWKSMVSTSMIQSSKIRQWQWGLEATLKSWMRRPRLRSV